MSPFLKWEREARGTVMKMLVWQVQEAWRHTCNCGGAGSFERKTACKNGACSLGAACDRK